MKFIVIGCGRMGAGLARVLDNAAHDVIAVDVEERAFRRLGPTFKGHRVAGVGFDQEVLQHASIADAGDIVHLAVMAASRRRLDSMLGTR